MLVGEDLVGKYLVGFVGKDSVGEDLVGKDIEDSVGGDLVNVGGHIVPRVRVAGVVRRKGFLRKLSEGRLLAHQFICAEIGNLTFSNLEFCLLPLSDENKEQVTTWL